MKFFNSNYILSNKRFGWIDYDRGISIILVTFRHCFENIERSGIDLKNYPYLGYTDVFLSGFRMPLFFIASGIFVSASLRKRGLSSYIENRLKTILYPMLVWGVIQISMQMFFSSYANSDVGPINYLYLIIDPRTTGQFWYLNALFCVGVLYSFLKVKMKFKLKYQVLFGLLLYFGGSYLRYKNIYLGFLMDILEYYIFFVLGDAVATFMMGEKGKKVFSSWKLFLPLFIAFCVIQYFFTQINLKNGDYFVEHSMPLFFLLVAIVGCAFSIAISFSLRKLQIMSFLRVVGFYSVHIYCIQIIAMSFVKIILIKVFGITNGLLLVALVWPCGVLLPMVFYNIGLRLNLWWIFNLKYPEEEIKYIAEEKMARQTKLTAK